MLSFHVKFVQTDRRTTVRQYAPIFRWGHKKRSGFVYTKQSPLYHIPYKKPFENIVRKGEQPSDVTAKAFSVSPICATSISFLHARQCTLYLPFVFVTKWIPLRSFSAVDTLASRAGTGRNFVPGYPWVYYPRILGYLMLSCPIKLKINSCPSLCILALAHVHVRPNMASNSPTLSKSQIWQYFSLLPGKQKTKCKLFYFVFKDL